MSVFHFKQKVMQQTVDGDSEWFSQLLDDPSFLTPVIALCHLSVCWCGCGLCSCRFSDPFEPSRETMLFLLCSDKALRKFGTVSDFQSFSGC